jgi:cysteine desulfurase/selenocysteine lyase
MIAQVDFYHSTYKEPPHRFEAGTPDFAGAIGLGVALDYLDAIGLENIARHDEELAALAIEKLLPLPGLRLLGPRTGHAGAVSFLLQDIHAHDVVTVADQLGVALRGGHHCNQPLMKKLGVESTARASFYFYNTASEVDRLIDTVREIQKFFGP